MCVITQKGFVQKRNEFVNFRMFYRVLSAFNNILHYGLNCYYYAMIVYMVMLNLQSANLLMVNKEDCED
jgi:hypothetical protein